MIHLTCLARGGEREVATIGLCGRASDATSIVAKVNMVHLPVVAFVEASAVAALNKVATPPEAPTLPDRSYHQTHSVN